MSTAPAVEESFTNASSFIINLKDWVTTNGLTFGANVLAAIIVYLVGKWVAKLLSRFVEKILKGRGIDKTVSGYVANIVYSLVLIMVIITALGKLGVPTAQFAAIIAAAGLAIGLALQGNLSNFASGFMLIFFRPVKVGDYINAGGSEGILEEIGIFTSILKTLDNKKVIVPNSGITGGNIVNFSANTNRLVAIPISAAPSNDPKSVGVALLAATDNNEWVLKDPAPVAVITELGEGKFVMELRAWCKSSDYWDTLFSLNQAVKSSLEKANVVLYMPHQAVKVIQ